MAVVSGTAGAAASTDVSGLVPAKKETVSKETFLQLLVAQIKNQNPLSPADGVQFITQLAQFSELEQMVSLRTDVEAIRTTMESQKKTETAGVDNV